MKRKPKEDDIKAKRHIALKLVDVKGYDEFSRNDDHESLLARKFNTFLSRFKRNKERNFSRPRGKEDSDEKK